MKNPTRSLFVIAALAFTLGLLAQQTTIGQSPSGSAIAAPDPAVIAKLQEIIAIREREMASYELLRGTGRPVDDLTEANLVEARIQLARERGQTTEVRTELKKLVAAHQRRLQEIERLANDRMPAIEVDRMKVLLLQAEVRLLKEGK